MAATSGTPRARALSAALREARQASGFGVRELARNLSISHTQISHWETGHRVPDVEATAMILAALRVTPDERERILQLARNVSEPNWLTVGVSGIPQQLAGAIESERAARAIVEWIPMIIPGLLQTPDYSRSIMEANGLSQNDIDIRNLVKVGRTEILTRENPVQFTALIGEAALFEPIGNPQTMVGQLKHLLAASNWSNVSVQIVPLRQGWHPGFSGPFVLYYFPDSSPVVHFEHYSSGAFVPTEYDVSEYQRAVSKIEYHALNPAESAAFISEAITKWDNET